MTVWEFEWQKYHYYVAATDENAAREHLREKHFDIADHASEPRDVGTQLLNKLKLKEGEVHRAGEFEKFER